MNIYLLRHCSTYNSENNLFPNKNNCYLSNKGINDTLTYIVPKVKNIPFNYILTSTYQSCLDTSMIINNNLKYKPDKISRTELLDERNFGCVSDMNYNDVISKYGNDLVSNWKMTIHNSPQGGETYYQMYKKIKKPWDKEILKFKDTNVLIISHLHTLKVIINIIENENINNIPLNNIDMGEIIVYEI